MAGWLQVLLSVGVITLETAAATSAGESPVPPATEISISLPTISDLPEIKLYTSQSAISDKIKLDTTSTNTKDARPFHVVAESRGPESKQNDSLQVTILPPATFLWKKAKKGIDTNFTEDDKDDMDFDIGMPVALALKTSGNGYTRSDGTYIVNDDDGVACVMAYFKAQATIYYPDNKGAYQTKVISPAEDSEIFGNCDRVGQVSEVSVKWSSFTLSLRFGKDDLTDSYFVSRFSLAYNLGDNIFSDSAAGSSMVTVTSNPERKFWQTNNYYSFRCLLLHDISLSDAFNNTATLHFDEVRSQAFCDEAYFKRPKHCIHRVHRDEMVPVTVGASLAGSTVLTVIVYGIFRYIKIKKVQYDTMA